MNALDEDLKANTKRITELINQSPACGLLEQPGIGPVTAAVALTAWFIPEGLGPKPRSPASPE